MKAGKEVRKFLGAAGRKGGSSKSPAKIEAVRRNIVIARTTGGRGKGSKLTEKHKAKIRASIAATRKKGVRCGGWPAKKKVVDA